MDSFMSSDLAMCELDLLNILPPRKTAMSQCAPSENLLEISNNICNRLNGLRPHLLGPMHLLRANSLEKNREAVDDIPNISRKRNGNHQAYDADDDCGDFTPPTLRKNYAPFFGRLQSESIPNVLPQRCSSSARDSDDLSVPVSSGRDYH
eukprot:3532117-Rhodomonas_salina.1